MEDIYRNCERFRFVDKSIHCLVRWSINKLEENEGDIFKGECKFHGAPKEMTVVGYYRGHKSLKHMGW